MARVVGGVGEREAIDMTSRQWLDALAHAFDLGVKAVQTEAEPWCSRSFACTRTPANPYRVTTTAAASSEQGRAEGEGR